MHNDVGILSIPSTEIAPSSFVDIRPPDGFAYLLTIGVVSGTTGACVISIHDSTGGMQVLIAQPISNRVANAGGFVTSNHDSWIRIDNIDGFTAASYAVSGIIVKIAAR